MGEGWGRGWGAGGGNGLKGFWKHEDTRHAYSCQEGSEGPPMKHFLNI